MHDVYMIIIVRACITRIKNGETVEAVVDSYVKLNTEDKAQLISKLAEGGHIYGTISE